MRSPVASDVDLAAGLLLPLARLRGLLSALRPTRRKGGVSWYRWTDLAPVIESEPMWAARREARERLRRRVTGSRYWVDGYPPLVEQWHPRNSLLPYQVSHGSARRVWWKCKAGPDHEWVAAVSNRTRGAGCPFCTNRRPSVTNSLATCHPDIAAQWDHTRNGKLSPERVLRSSGIRVWWKCRSGRDHRWLGPIHDRTSGRERRCPFCSGARASSTNSLATCHPRLAGEWASRLNGKLTPRDVTANSSRSVWWRCSVARGHVWKATVSNRVGRQSGCPFCSKLYATPADSLARIAPQAAELWHPTKNGERTPMRVRATSRKRAWWLCKRGHIWHAEIRSVVGEPSCAQCRLQSPRVAQTKHRTTRWPG